MKQGKKAQRARLAAREKQLRQRVRGMTLEVNTGRVVDEAVRRLCRLDKYPELAADLDVEIERVINENDIKETENHGRQEDPQAQEGDLLTPPR